MSKTEKKQTSAAKIYDFCGKRRMVIIIYAIIIVLAIAAPIIRGVDLAIEFKGGTLISYTYTGDIDIKEATSTVNDIVGTSVTIRSGESLESGDKELTISFTSETGLTADRQAELSDTLAAKYPDNNIVLYDSNDVTPTTGKEFFLKCIIAVIFAAILIIIYIAIRFRKIGGWSAGFCSILALVHDLIVAVTTSIICGFEINSNIVAVILTILGYSINNTIVIYDRIRENKKLTPKASTNDIINAGCSQSLTRSIRTSITTIGTMLIITIVVLVSGYTSLLTFSVPLMLGLISGTYSSLFVAPCIWSWILDRKKTNKK